MREWLSPAAWITSWQSATLPASPSHAPLPAAAPAPSTAPVVGVAVGVAKSCGPPRVEDELVDPSNHNNDSWIAEAAEEEEEEEEEERGRGGEDNDEDVDGLIAEVKEEVDHDMERSKVSCIG